MIAGAIRAGAAFVEIFAHDSKFQAALKRVQDKLKATGAAMRQMGTQLAIGGAALGAPIGLALRQFTAFDDTLRQTQASIGATVADMDRIRASAMELSKSLGLGPTEVAKGFMELLKAGMSLDQVLAGAGEAAIAFGRVGGMAVSDAATTMADAMAVFRVGGEEAANTLSAAADSSSTDIQGIAQAFAQVSAVAGLANQSIGDTAAALAILANAGVKGSDAGTSLKTMLMRLMAPADDAVGALDQLGLSVNSFRNADGTMQPLVNIVGTLTNAMAGMDQAARDDVFRRIFGSDAIRAAAVMTATGVDGINAMRQAMNGAMSVGDKFSTMQGGLSGAMASLAGSAERLSEAVGSAVAPSMQAVAAMASRVADVVRQLVVDFPGLAQFAATLAGGMLGLGTALIGVGIAFQIAGKGIAALRVTMTSIPAAVSVIGKALPLLLSPVGLAITGVTAGVAAFALAARDLSPAFRREFDGIMAAIMRLDFGTAWKMMRLNFTIALTQMAGNADQILRLVQGFFAATGAFIGDKLIEGFDRFMGLFGADIITMQSAFARLGIYFRAAFDWQFAATGMKKALDEADRQAERARARAPTAAARADARASDRQQDADRRQADADRSAAEYRRSIARQRQELDAIHAGAKRADGRPAAGGAAAVAGQPVQAAVAGAMAPDGMTPVTAGRDIGRTVGTFGSADGLGIGPELTKLEEPARETARNTARIADALAAPAGSAVASSPAAAAAPQVAADIRDGLAVAAEVRAMATGLTTGMAAVVRAVDRHASLTEAGNKILAQILNRTGRQGVALQ